MSSTPAFNKLSGVISSSRASTSGSTRTTATTSAFWATLRSRFLWNGSGRRFPDMPARVSVPNYHGFSALAVFSSVAARFFTPQIGGAGAVPSVALAGGSTPFRIDHDEKFNLTTHLQYQPWKLGPWFGFNWRYDSGLVAGQTPCYGGNCAQTTVDSTGAPAIALTDSFGAPLTADQEFESGLFCGSQRATPTTLIGVSGAPGSPSLVCPVGQFGSSLLQVPKPNTENDDKNPPRIAGAKSLRRFHRT